jgi:two-component system, chemotaxis family, response regulator Rcp1
VALALLGMTRDPRGQKRENRPGRRCRRIVHANRKNNCVILYAEDSDAMAYLLQKALEDSGTDAQLFRVDDGKKALAFLYRQGIFHDAPRPDVVILDLNLPKKSGFEVLEEIGRSDGLKELPVVIFSSSSRPADLERALALGAREFFRKPSEWEDFLAKSKSICDLARPVRYRHRSPHPEAQYIDYRLPVLGIRIRKISYQIISRMGNDWVPVGTPRNLPVNLPPKGTMPGADESVFLIAWRYEQGHPDTDLRKVLTGEKPFETALADHT